MPKLLLADDSPTTQKVVQLTFADEGIDVVVADDGDTALELYTHHHPDIVLADINIPGLNGYEVCEAIRKRQDNGLTPVILLAGSFEPFDVERAHHVGASDYLTKPFSSIRRLVATVTALLDTAARQDSSVEETIEPTDGSESADRTEPASDQVAEAGPSPESGPGPTLPPEPNPYATDDIENLIQQSFVETVEMPHTVAERVMSDIAAAKAAQDSEDTAVSHDGIAFDDELIETTFANEPDGSLEQANEPQFEAQNIASTGPPESAGETVSIQPEISSSNGFSEPNAPELRLEPLGEQYVPPESEYSEPHAETIEPLVNSEAPQVSVQPDTSALSQAPTEEFQIDQSGDETYFEPAVETMDDSVELPRPAAEEQTGFEIVSIQEPERQTDQPVAAFETEQESYDSIPDQTAEFEGQGTEKTDEYIASPSTPWDSVAEPPLQRFQIDESNLLELPTGFADRVETAPPDLENAVANASAEIAPELVDEIARVTASQISEELVREIANRIVPRVVEEVMARHRGENSDE